MKKLILIALAAVLAACGQSPKGSGREKLAGAGATFPLPYYNLAFKTYRDSVPAEVSYGGIGSGGGIRSLKDRIVDFAGSDAYLTDAEMAAMPDSVIHIPTCMGAVVMAYNLPGVEKLKLTGELVADIYLGKITRWNDARIRGINPGVQLPDLEIHPVYRSDGSGTTFVFSDYLTKVSHAWKETIGAGKSLEWPAGLAAKGNPGISGTVSQTEGAVGYIGSGYAFAQHISYASLQNKAGRFIDPTLESISAAAAGDLPTDTRCMITDPDAADAYPISCFTWILLYKEQGYDKRTREQSEALVDLLGWMLGSQAQDLAGKVNYAPLPQQVIDNGRAQLGTVTYKGEKLLK